MPRITELHVNGEIHHIDADGNRSLLGFLRDEVGLTGCKYGCGEGQCGACTILLDGVPTRSCLTSLAEVGGRMIATVEGLEQNGTLHPVQEAFLKVDALQCGYCTCGMILAAVALLEKNAAPSDDEVVRAMNGHICRCGVYQRIVAAIKDAAAAMRPATK